MFQIINLGELRSGHTRMQSFQTRQSENIFINILMENESKLQSLRGFFSDLHQRYWTKTGKSYDLLITRLNTIFLWYCVTLIEFLAYSNIINSSSMILNLLFGFSYLLKNTIAIVYAAGAAAFGISIEIYLLIPLVICNSILAIKNCGINHGESRGSSIFMFTTMALFLGTELAYQNFKRFTYQQSYQLHYQTATRAMIRPSVYLCVTMMFLISPGLRAIYNATRLKCPYVYESTNGSNCKLIDMSRPTFEDNHPCVSDFTAMMTSFEQLRVIRDIALCSIAFYSMYNKAFLDITGIISIIHKLVLLLFFAMSCSVVIVSVDSFKFSKQKFYFNCIETMMFSVVIILLVFNLRKKSKHRKEIIMEANPTILG